MKIKTTLAIAALAASVGGLSACASAESKTSAAAPPPAAGTTPTTPAVPSTPAAPSSSTASASDPATPTSAGTASSSPSAPIKVLKSIPASAILAATDLAPSKDGSWAASRGWDQPIKVSEIIDPDNCDPVARPQSVDPNYPRNPAWTGMQTVSWAGPNSTAQVTESVITYSSAGAAAADFGKHQGWVGSCSTHFQWTDMPAKYAVSSASLPQVNDAYAIRVAMYSPTQPVSSAGSQGYDYMAVILRGNALAVVSLSESGSGDAASKTQDPGLSAAQHDFQVAASKLGSAFGIK